MTIGKIIIRGRDRAADPGAGDGLRVDRRGVRETIVTMRPPVTTCGGLDSANEVAAPQTSRELGQKLKKLAGQFRI